MAPVSKKLKEDDSNKENKAAYDDYYEQRLALNLAPTFLVKPYFVEEDEGNKVLFITRLFANPKPAIKWLKDDVELKQSERIVIKVTELAENILASQVIIDDINELDAGQYKITAINNFGEVSSAINFEFIRKYYL